MNLFVAFIIGLSLTAIVVCHVADARDERRRRARVRRARAIARSKAMHPSNYRRSFRP